MTTSPISNLNADAVLSIFDTLTSGMPVADTRTPWMDRPLIVMQNASQVCRRWRGFLLGSPWIWGRLVDLDVLTGQRTLEWMEEIWRRARAAPLWIHGSYVSVHEEGGQHFIRLLDSWERIEKLAVRIYSINAIPDAIQSRFLSPTPILKLFDVRFLGINGLGDPLFLRTLEPGSSSSLFADHAPSLQTLRSSRVAYRVDAPWLSHIREIRFFPANLTVEDILILLHHTPVIETIALNSRVVSQQIRITSQKINLPRLTSIRMWTNLPAVAVILNDIIPGRLSAFCINIDNHQTGEVYDPDIQSAFKRGLERHITNYFTANPRMDVLFEIIGPGLRLCDLTTTTGTIREFNTEDFEVVSYWLSNRDDLVVCFLDTFIASLSANPSVLKCITQMRLPRLEVKPTIITKLHSFLALFRHVRVIETDEEYGPAFCALPCLDNPQHVLFPELRTLQLASTHVEDHIICADLTGYIMTRKRLGFPLAKLDFTSCTRSNYAQDLRDLERADGLEVVWRVRKNEFGDLDDDEIRSYICGTGKPEQLTGLVDNQS